jgi:hypothetical protein
MSAKKEAQNERMSLTASLVAKPGDKNKKDVVLKRAKYELVSDDGTIEGVFYAIVPKGKTPAETITLSIVPSEA